jgi:hypothetical protein
MLDWSMAIQFVERLPEPLAPVLVFIVPILLVGDFKKCHELRGIWGKTGASFGVLQGQPSRFGNRDCPYKAPCTHA